MKLYKSLLAYFILIMSQYGYSQLRVVSRENIEDKKEFKAVWHWLGGAGYKPSKKKFTMESVKVFDASGEEYLVDYWTPIPGKFEKHGARVMPMKISLNGKPYISLSQAFAASGPGSIIKLGPGTGSLPTLRVHDSIPKDIQNKLIGTGLPRSTGYRELIFLEKTTRMVFAKLSGIRIQGTGTVGEIDIPTLIGASQPKSARSLLHRFMDSQISQDQNAMLVPTIKSLKSQKNGYTLTKENFNGLKSDFLIPLPSSQINPGQVSGNAFLIVNDKNVVISDVSFIGDTHGQTTFIKKSDFYDLVVLQNCKNITFRNCAFINSMGFGLQIINSKNIRLENCIISGSVREGVFVINSDVIITNSELIGNGRGWRETVKPGFPDTDVILPSNSISSLSSLVIAKGNYFKGNGASSLYLDSGSDLVGINNVFDDNSAIVFEDCDRKATLIKDNIALNDVISGSVAFSSSSFTRFNCLKETSKPCTSVLGEGNVSSGGKIPVQKAMGMLGISTFSTDEVESYLKAYDAARAEYTMGNDWGGLVVSIIKCISSEVIKDQVQNPAVASVIVEMIKSSLEDRGISLENIGKDILIDSFAQAAEDSGQKGMVDIIKAGQLIDCLLK